MTRFVDELSDEDLLRRLLGTNKQRSSRRDASGRLPATALPGLAALAAGPLSRRPEPRLTTWLLAIAALVLAASSSLVLGLLAPSGLVRIPLAAALKDYAPDAIAREDPAARSAALACTILLTPAANATIYAILEAGVRPPESRGPPRRLGTPHLSM
ncbi:hypothetical protein [Streptomyces sp. NPDC048428]|uniref:hypothetical protein n=1 Tax=Streptomyces sp. NPDC048428 TaxID=3154503 RepID=UPI00341ADE6E